MNSMARQSKCWLLVTDSIDWRIDAFAQIDRTDGISLKVRVHMLTPIELTRKYLTIRANGTGMATE